MAFKDLLLYNHHYYNNPHIITPTHTNINQRNYDDHNFFFRKKWPNTISEILYDLMYFELTLPSAEGKGFDMISYGFLTQCSKGAGGNVFWHLISTALYF